MKTTTALAAAVVAMSVAAGVAAVTDRPATTGIALAGATDSPTPTCEKDCDVPSATDTPTPTASPSPTSTKTADPIVTPTPDATTEAPVPSAAPTLGPVVLRVANLLPGRQHWPVPDVLQDWNANGRVRLVPVSSCGPIGATWPANDRGCVDIVLEHHGDEHPAHTDSLGVGRWQIVMNAAVIPGGQSSDLHQWRQALVCHELGHVLLGTPNHLERGNGCMDVDVLEWRDHPGAILLNAVRTGVLPADMGV